jgi:hypothetical protein
VDRHDFSQLLKARGKEIKADIQFVQIRNLPEYIVVFDNAELENPLGYDIVANGSYNRKTGATKFNFVLRGTGPICRVEVGGFIHGSAGRTHKHDVQEPDDPRKDLPHAHPRPDLEAKNPREIWEDLCRRAGIEHTGRFIDPLEECNEH